MCTPCRLLLGGVPLLDADDPQLGWMITLKDDNRFILKGSAVEMLEELIEDVPLLPFSRIQEAYESTLSAKLEEQGKPMTDMLSAELGYMLVAEGENAGVDTIYITKPVWVLRGYVPETIWGGEEVRAMITAQEEAMLRHPRGMEIGLYMRTDFMCMDAQTGEVLNWPNLGGNYHGTAPTVLTWEEAHQ